MNKNAVFVLPFFIAGLTTVGSLGDILPDSQRAVVEFGNAFGVELLAQNYPLLKDTSVSEDKELLIIKTLITAYSSSVDETDDTPLITASGTFTRDGVAASNFLPIGARIRIPTIFGPKIFIVEDRMNSIYNDRVDIWLSTKEGALEFGKKVSHIEIL